MTTKNTFRRCAHHTSGGFTLFVIPPVSLAAMSHDEDDRVYEFTAGRFDDVTSFKGPRADDGNTDRYYRMYDAETNTIIYETADGEMAVRDAEQFSAYRWNVDSS